MYTACRSETLTPSQFMDIHLFHHTGPFNQETETWAIYAKHIEDPVYTLIDCAETTEQKNRLLDQHGKYFNAKRGYRMDAVRIFKAQITTL